LSTMLNPGPRFREVKFGALFNRLGSEGQWVATGVNNFHASQTLYVNE